MRSPKMSAERQTGKPSSKNEAGGRKRYYARMTGSVFGQNRFMRVIAAQVARNWDHLKKHLHGFHIRYSSILSRNARPPLHLVHLHAFELVSHCQDRFGDEGRYVLAKSCRF